MSESTEVASAPSIEPDFVPPAALEPQKRFVDDALDEYESPPLVAIEVPSLAQMMRQEINDTLGEEPTPESCEAALAMTTAARDFLLAQRTARFGHSYADSRAENLKRLRETFGSGADDNDPVP